MRPTARGRSPFDEIRHPKKRAFLHAFSRLGNKAKAASLVGIDRTTIYTAQWCHDPQFQAGLRIATEMAAEILEEEAHRRAVEGVERPVGWFKGRPGGYVREYSDVLLMFLLKGARPDKYKDRMEIRGGLATIDFARLSDEQLLRIRNGEHPLVVIGAGSPQAAPTAPGAGAGRVSQ